MAYSGEKWRKARQATLARDNRRCQDCGSASELHVHHIKPAAEFEAERDAHYMDNLVVLCKYCHASWEGRNERPKLADPETGTTLNEVVAAFSSDTVFRHAMGGAIPELYFKYIMGDPNRCNRCGKTLGSTRDWPWPKFEVFIDAIVSNIEFNLEYTGESMAYTNRCEACTGENMIGNAQRNSRWLSAISNYLHDSPYFFEYDHVSNYRNKRIKAITLALGMNDQHVKNYNIHNVLPRNIVEYDSNRTELEEYNEWYKQQDWVDIDYDADS